jgi:hypothetical protein
MVRANHARRIGWLIVLLPTPLCPAGHHPLEGRAIAYEAQSRSGAIRHPGSRAKRSGERLSAIHSVTWQFFAPANFRALPEKSRNGSRVCSRFARLPGMTRLAAPCQSRPPGSKCDHPPFEGEGRTEGSGWGDNRWVTNNQCFLTPTRDFVATSPLGGEVSRGGDGACPFEPAAGRIAMARQAPGRSCRLPGS